MSSNHNEFLNTEHAMKISDATRIYKEFGDEFRPDLESLVELFRENDIEEPLNNSNYLHALNLTDLMLSHTQESFRMLTGCAGDGFLLRLEKSVQSMLSRIKKSNGVARVILLTDEQNSESSAKAVSSAQETFGGSLQIMTVKLIEAAKMKHYIVCDGDMVRDEDYHPPLTDESSANLVKAKVFFKNKSKANTFSVKFDTLWDMVTGR